MQRRLLVFSFLSGISALIYEITWVRVLSVVFGSTTYSISAVLAVFMAGMAIGNRVFGRRIDRNPRPLRTYAVIEFGLALLAVALSVAIPSLHSSLAIAQTVVPDQAGWIVRIALGSLFLLPPTILMGATLPVLARCFARYTNTSKHGDATQIVRFVSQMYGLNTLYAVSGCLLAALVFVPLLGLRWSIFVAAGMNGAIGLLAWKMSNSVNGFATVAQAQPAIASRLAGSKPLFHRIGPIGFAFVSGFIVLAVEVIWTRLLINQLSGNVLVFAVILSAFLAGMGLAGLVVGRFYQPENASRGLMMLLVLNGFWLIASVASQSVLAELFDWIHQFGYDQPGLTSLACLAALFCILVPATTTLGCVCPWLLAMETQADTSRVGHAVGRLLSWNTIGAISGSLIAGFVMLGALGAPQSLLVLATFCFVAAVFAVHGPVGFAVSTAGVILCAVLFHDGLVVSKPALWFNAGFTRVARLPAEDTMFFKEGVEGTIAVTVDGDALRLLVNGVVVADSSREDMWDLLLKAHLPMLLHPAPKRIAVVGLGAGISLGAIEAYEQVESIDCIELCPEVVDAHRLFGSFNGRCWNDPRLRLHIDDGRHFLLTSPNTYDVINVDPIDPPVCNQYTQEFVQVCHDHLNNGGLMVQWIPLFHLTERHLRSMAAGFVNVFPNTTLWYDGTSILLIGRKGGPLTIHLDQLVARGRDDRVRDNLAVIGRPDPLILCGTFVCGSARVARWIGNAKPNTDDRPWLEYELLLSGPLHRDAFRYNLRRIRQLYEDNRDAPQAGTTELVSNAQNVRSALTRLLDARIAKLDSDHESADQIIQSIIDDFGLDQQAFETLAPLMSD